MDSDKIALGVTADIDAQTCATTHGLFKVGDMRAAFNALFDENENWKEQIGAVINHDDLLVTFAGIEFFAGGGAELTHRVGDQCLIEAPGYYNLIGA